MKYIQLLKTAILIILFYFAGGTKNSKKVIDIKDDIISTADKESPISQTESGNKLRKRNKPAKDSTRTLMISSNEDVGVPSAGQTAESLISNGSTSQCTDRISQENFVTNSSNRQPVQQNGTEADKLVSKKSVNKSESISSVNDTSKASKMKDTDIDAADGENWSQNQQVILEWALRQYPKGTEQRWEKIADQIPGKNKVWMGLQAYGNIFTLYSTDTHFEASPTDSF